MEVRSSTCPKFLWMSDMKVELMPLEKLPLEWTSMKTTSRCSLIVFQHSWKNIMVNPSRPSALSIWKTKYPFFYLFTEVVCLSKMLFFFWNEFLSDYHIPLHFYLGARYGYILSFHWRTYEFAVKIPCVNQLILEFLHQLISSFKNTSWS